MVSGFPRVLLVPFPWLVIIKVLFKTNNNKMNSSQTYVISNRVTQSLFGCLHLFVKFYIFWNLSIDSSFFWKKFTSQPNKNCNFNWWLSCSCISHIDIIIVGTFPAKHVIYYPPPLPLYPINIFLRGYFNCSYFEKP